ncbi:sigma-70 family RNA polymerase sigma factor [Actinospica sp. MGRD01-02]|uniref:Sigma-70 family RNA polymerase sigma factor n=1 Tax=Actinospica acidithermotolerans TaxID=2828514 RepID=A0A941IJP6_9ACTN|nr:sigma-70 family RNA polymerase sigma factor [Actinospica acidithermotolerans]MBR7829694.1 sigma-70 family RNA polymerase sigma factor [Actinospica acidithermotolerans]
MKAKHEDPADEAFLAKLYAMHGGELLAYIRRVSGSHHDAEDIVQETMLRAWGHIATLDEASGTIRGWLFTVARRILIDRLRLKSAIPAGVYPAGIDSGAQHLTVADHQVASAERIDVVSALSRLTPEHRSALFAVYYHGQTVAGAARSLGVPPGTVKSRLHYGLRSLRAVFESERDDEDCPGHSRLSGSPA